MTEQAEMLDKAVSRLFAHLMAGEMPATHCADSLRALWHKVEELGIPNIFLPEEVGGFNGDWRDACVVFRRIGLHAVPAPIGETIVARRWLLHADVEAPEGPLTLGSCLDAQIDNSSGQQLFNGTVGGVAWGAQAAAILIAARTAQGECWALLPGSAEHSVAVIDDARNIAGEPRATLQFTQTPLLACWRADNAINDLIAAGALLRAGQMAGALEAALQLSIDYANERKQFGRSIGKFQAIQQQLAVLAEEAAAISCAARSACYAVDCNTDPSGNGKDHFAASDLQRADFEIAAAKLRANRAAAQATSIAHQVHGAIGFTHEHNLHRFTLRLLAWRGEFGNDRHWATYLGRLVVDYKNADRNGTNDNSLWRQITGRGDRALNRGASL